MIKYLTILMAVSLSLSSSASWFDNIPSKNLGEISRFTSDSCSSFPNGILGKESDIWSHCCIAHDISYWIGGESTKRKIADTELKQCVSESTNVFLGYVMEAGVNFGGSTYLPTTWRWAYGWKKNQNYKPLNNNQIINVKEKFNTVFVELDMWKDSLSKYQREYISSKILDRYEEINKNVNRDELNVLLNKLIEFEED